MDQIETVFLLNQMRYNQLLELAEKERMITNINRERALPGQLPRALSLWDRITALNKIKICKKLFGEYGSTNPCCNQTEKQLS